MKRIAAVLCVVFSFFAIAVGQVARKTVTNADLEAFREKRVAAEKEYRDTYAAKGLPSPEELQAATDARVKETIDLGNKLRAEQLERERLALQAEAQQQAALAAYYNGGPVYYPYDNSVLSYGYFGGRSGFGRRFRGRVFSSNGLGGVYAAGGNVWPAPPGSIRQRPQPMIRRSLGRH